MRFLYYFLAFLAIAFFAIQAWNLYAQKRKLEYDLANVLQKTAPVAAENAKLVENLNGLKDPATIARELRRAGYAAPGEKVFVIMPKK